MKPRIHLVTGRLILRDWTGADAEPLAALNGDPRVMEFFPNVQSRAQSDALIARETLAIAGRGYGLYAVVEKASGGFIGFVGLAPIDFSAAFMPTIEIGWRLSRRSWGSGYATEAARAVVGHAFGPLALPALVAITTEWNLPSRRVMEKIGMTRDLAGDFQHPNVPTGHKLAPHVLYRISREDWAKRA